MGTSLATARTCLRFRHLGATRIPKAILAALALMGVIFWKPLLHVNCEIDLYSARSDPDGRRSVDKFDDAQFPLDLFSLTCGEFFRLGNAGTSL